MKNRKSGIFCRCAQDLQPPWCTGLPTYIPQELCIANDRQRREDAEKGLHFSPRKQLQEKKNHSHVTTIVITLPEKASGPKTQKYFNGAFPAQKINQTKMSTLNKHLLDSFQIVFLLYCCYRTKRERRRNQKWAAKV